MLASVKCRSEVIHNKIRRPFLLAMPLALCILFLTNMAWPQSTVFAASIASPLTHMSAGSASTILPAKEALPSSVKAESVDLCWHFSPTYQIGTIGHNFPFTIRWNCGPWYQLLWTVSWGDGNQSYYMCWVNCVSGATTFYHSYHRPGRFSLRVGQGPFVTTSGIATIVVDSVV